MLDYKLCHACVGDVVQKRETRHWIYRAFAADFREKCDLASFMLRLVLNLQPGMSGVHRRSVFISRVVKPMDERAPTP